MIRAIRLSCGLTQREAGVVFGGGEKPFEKYESGAVQPSEPTKRLLKLAMERPELFRRQEDGLSVAASTDDVALIHQTLRAAAIDHIYGRLFATTGEPYATR